MKVLISGSTGLVGSHLVEAVREAGHEPWRLVRRPMNLGEPEVQYDIGAGTIDLEMLSKVDAIVHLAGENIASFRWTEAKKQSLWSSRIDSTAAVCNGIAALDDPPKVLINASAIGFYGSRANEDLTEQSPAGRGFLADLCQAWEAATQPAIDKGVRVANARISVVVSTQGGPIAQMLTPFKLGIGGVIGSGKQWFSWIALPDILRAIMFILENESISGPVNLCAPEPVTNREMTKTIGRAIHRPTIFPLPAPIARLAMGEMADELVLASAKVFPAKLQSEGFEFDRPDFEGALRGAIEDAQS